MAKSVEDLPYIPLMSESSAVNKTGVWRVIKPIVNQEECNQCYICWKFCPDVAIHIDEEGSILIDYDHCKGCGICEAVCPKKCIEMVKEE
ncbi:MAG: 4Fe-4S binding protein [Candidatus Thermoplasmatota archaeon]|nr:4Fe-4S binding protein [Candidatus Thermoplasmatota archaeon]MCJ2670196.1 4Fe-4S binding protein [Candidatus Thermoplasmatota archaeon]